MTVQKARFVLDIAFRHLSGKRRQTSLVIAGIAVGSMAMILTFGLAEGVIADIKNKIIDISPLITIKGEKVEGKQRLLMSSSPYSADHFEIVSRIVPDDKKEVKPYTEVVSLVHALPGIDIVVGTFASGFGAVDDNNAYINLRLGQTINGFAENVVSAIGIHTTSLGVVDPLSKKISELTGYRTETWEEANANLLALFERNNNITFFLVMFVFVVAGFGIANVLITIVLQKQRDIAVMKSMGVSVRSLEMVFLAEGMILGIVGAIIGVVAGHYLTNLISSLPISYGPSAVVRGNHIVTVQKPLFYILTILFAIVVSAVSGFGPARRAARLKPVDILRA